MNLGRRRHCRSELSTDVIEKSINLVAVPDIARAHRFGKRLKAGTVWVNTYGPTDVRLPWGGSRDSGFGREHGDAAIENFTEPKVMWINTGR